MTHSQVFSRCVLYSEVRKLNSVLNVMNSMISASPSCTTPSQGGGFATVGMVTGKACIFNIVDQPIIVSLVFLSLL